MYFPNDIKICILVLELPDILRQASLVAVGLVFKRGLVVIPTHLKISLTTADVVLFGAACSNNSFVYYRCLSTLAVDWARGAGAIALFHCIALVVLLKKALFMTGYD